MSSDERTVIQPDVTAGRPCAGRLDDELRRYSNLLDARAAGNDIAGPDRSPTGPE